MNSSFWLDMVTALWFGVTGSCIGSFLNVVAYRVPLGMSVVWKPSHCPKCDHPIRACDNVPVLGWLLLRGRCRDCGKGISPRYAIVELAMGVAFFVLAYVELFRGGGNLPGALLSEQTGALENVWQPNWQALGLFGYHATLLSLLMVVALIDGDRRRVPWKVILFGLLVAAVGAVFWPHLYPQRADVASLGISRFQAPADACLGGLGGIAPWVMTYLGFRTKFRDQPALASLLNFGIALGFVGAMLGFWPMILTLGLALPVIAGIRHVNRLRSSRDVSSVFALWLSSLLLIGLWRPLEALLK